MNEARRLDLKPVDDLNGLDTSINPVFELFRIADGRSIMPGYGTTFEGFTLPNLFGQHQDIPSFAIMTHDLIRQVFGDFRNFSSDLFSEDFLAATGRGLFCMDPPEHTIYRQLAQKGFTPRIVQSWDEHIVKPTIERCFAAVRGRGKCDLAQDIAVNFPYQIICQILGLPPSDFEYVGERLRKIGRATYDPTTALTASKEMHEYVGRYIEERRRRRSDDFISALMDAEVDGEKLSDTRLRAFIFHLFPAGVDTTYRAASNLSYLLLSHPEQLETVRRDRTLVARAVEETLRFEGPATMFPRLAKHDVVLGDTAIPAGSMIYLMLAAGNRDSTRWDRPHEFDVSREQKGHLGFGYGPHACIGLHLARKELQIYLETLLDEMPGVRWDPQLQSIPPMEGWTLRSALTVPVAWTPT